MKTMYTGSERDVPAEHVTSEYLHKKETDQGFDPQEVRNPSPGYKFETETGGVMPMDDTTRETVDEIAGDYEVALTYDEGVVQIRGEREEIESFVDEICGSDQVMEGADHPHDSISPDAQLDTGSRIIGDGGTSYGMPIGGQETYIQDNDEDMTGIGTL